MADQIKVIKAIATSPLGASFFKGIVEGDGILFKYHREKNPTIIIGIPATENIDTLTLSQAIAVTPKQLLEIKEDTGYSPAECLMAFYIAMMQMSTLEQSSLQVQKSTIQDELLLLSLTQQQDRYFLSIIADINN